jgi:hypothetical protein
MNRAVVNLKPVDEVDDVLFLFLEVVIVLTVEEIGDEA